MSRKGCSPDNAACEGFFGRLKTELFYPSQWQATTLAQFMQVLDGSVALGILLLNEALPVAFDEG